MIRYSQTTMAKEPILLDKLNQDNALEQDEYKRQLKKYQLEILNHQLLLRERKNSIIIVMEGPDAAGKGGAIKRLVERLDPRLVRVYSIIKPTQEEISHHYLWRFWTKLPAHGEMTIYDRSWYGRVLVERVEGFCKEQEWKRAYREINEFERLLVDDGNIIIKMFLHITKDEQLERFKRREADPYKHWKISEEDWRNRRKWNEHNEAASEMFEKTSTEIAPWTVIPANFKWYARVKVAKTVAERLKTALG
ncbi:MAG: polyphosphate kinase 2 family protein [Terrimicrobiaceae bacterium]